MFTTVSHSSLVFVTLYYDLCHFLEETVTWCCLYDFGFFHLQARSFHSDVPKEAVVVFLNTVSCIGLSCLNQFQGKTLVLGNVSYLP